MPRLVLITGILAALLAVVAGVALSFLRNDAVYQGVQVNGVELGGLTLRAAEDRLSPAADNLANEHVVLRYADQTSDTTFSDIGGKVDVRDTVRAAHQVGRAGSVFHRLAEIVSARRHGRRLPFSYSLDRDAAADFLKTIAARVDRKPTDAGLIVDGDSIRITPQRPGIELDQEKSLLRLARAADSGLRDVTLIVGAAQPRITEPDLRGITGLMASYSTSYKPWEKDRSHNLSIACRAVNGTLIRPGETFSYNKEVGPRLKKYGFRDAPIFVKGEVEPGTGGGVCQVSTTVYNAALLADLKIVRRSHHCMPVHYAPVGRDATVAPTVDLKFRNTSDTAVYVLASVGAHTVNVSILGAKPDGRKVELESVGHKVIEAPVTRVTRDDIKPGQSVVSEPGRSGHRVSTYRIVKLDGRVVRRELISTDYYRPEARVVAVAASVPKPPASPLADTH